MGKRHNAHPKQRKRTVAKKLDISAWATCTPPYACPWKESFSSDAAALAVGVLLVSGLEKAGAEVFLKWPNDIIQISTGTGIRSSEKIGGILLEERKRNPSGRNRHQCSLCS